MVFCSVINTASIKNDDIITKITSELILSRIDDAYIYAYFIKHNKKIACKHEDSNKYLTTFYTEFSNTKFTNNYSGIYSQYYGDAIKNIFN